MHILVYSSKRLVKRNKTDLFFTRSNCIMHRTGHGYPLAANFRVGMRASHISMHVESYSMRGAREKSINNNGWSTSSSTVYRSIHACMHDPVSSVAIRCTSPS